MLIVMFLMAKEFLAKKQNLILDATFGWKESRNLAREIAKKNKTEFKIVEVKCREKIL